MEEYCRPLARLHAVAMAAIVLRGEPKVDEPLQLAWVRAAERYGIDKDVALTKHYSETARALLPKIIKPATENTGSRTSVSYIFADGSTRTQAEIADPTPEESNTFSNIFRDVPSWLANFTFLIFDALYLKFEFVTAPFPIRWGRDGREEAMHWPELPMGMMTAGERDPPSDQFDGLSSDDVFYWIQLRDKPEYEWSLSDRRRWRAVFEHILNHPQSWTGS